ncbi:hypothetical protein DDT91_13325 [Algoriphagus sp. AK58]|nr:hypothetical protein [Algoriphagus sp. AK58]
MKSKIQNQEKNEENSHKKTKGEYEFRKSKYKISFKLKNLMRKSSGLNRFLKDSFQTCQVLKT